MDTKWLHIIGLGEEGLSGLSQQAQDAIKTSDEIIADKRFHAMLKGAKLKAQIHDYPKPFHALYESLKAKKHKKMVIIASGDGLWFGVASSLVKRFNHDEIKIYPHISSFQLAISHLHWPMDDCETLTIHGRLLKGETQPHNAIARLASYAYPGAKLLILPHDGQSPYLMAKSLKSWGYHHARVFILERLASEDEAIFSYDLDELLDLEQQQASFHPFHIMAIEIAKDEGTHTPFMIDDNDFIHDGKMTKQAPRATAILALKPFPRAVMWDIGCGAGAVAIDFARHAKGAQIYAVDILDKRLEFAKENALKFGMGHIHFAKGNALNMMKDWPSPHRVFVGGGLSKDLFDCIIERLLPKGVMVAHGVTVESELLLLSLYKEKGGELHRHSHQHGEILSEKFTGWRQAMTVTQYIYKK